MRKTPINRQSSKQASRGGFGFNSTIRKKPDAKPLKKENPERQAKSRKRQASKHRAYMASETRKVVDARADGQCETIVRPNGWGGVWITVPPRDLLRLPHVPYHPFAPRCENRQSLAHHHLTYARYGGNEQPDDVVKACPRCHDYLESLKPVHRSWK